ncbi:MAG: ATP-binding cassette domain-containing protein, partial [Candidatus Poseidoniaceae archaeon]|nr:ATP-binding cassette domain-containing protein [Candidatus Poseidoniaceae archaeon]
MAEVLLSIKGAEVRRGMGIVLSSFGLEVNSGDITVIHGANGSGKSTVIETAARLLPLEKGQVSHHQHLTMHSDGRRKKPVKPFGLTLQSNGVIGSETIENHLRTVAALSGKEVDLAPLLESYDIKHRTQDIIAHLSGGQQRKVAVLAGLLPAMISSEPTLVLLDEPDAGLDDAAIKTLTQHITSLASAGHGFLIASHNPSLRTIGTKLHNLTSENTGTVNTAEPWQAMGQPKETSNVLFRTGHRY